MAKPYPVYVVDDEAEIRELLCLVCEERDLSCQAFGTGEDFLAALDGLTPGCVLLDMRLPRMKGLEVQAEIVRRGRPFAVVTITGYGYVDMAVDSMKLGAVDFLEKPFLNEVLYDALDRAFARLQEISGSSPDEG